MAEPSSFLLSKAFSQLTGRKVSFIQAPIDPGSKVRQVFGIYTVVPHDVGIVVKADLLLMGFRRGPKWRAFIMMSDSFWQTYRHTADPELVKAAEVAGGRILGALLMMAVDGPSPLKELV